MRETGRWRRLAVAVVFAAVVVALFAGTGGVSAQPASSQSSSGSAQPTATPDAVPSGVPTPAGGGSDGADSTEGEPSPNASPGEATEQPDVDPTGVETPTSDATPDQDTRSEGAGGIPPSVRRSGIPLGSILLAVGVLAAVGLGALVVVRRGRPTATEAGANGTEQGPFMAPAPHPHRTPAPVALPSPLPSPSPSAEVGPKAGADPELLTFLLELGEALVDAGDAVNSVGETLHAVARTQGLADVGVIVLPTAIIVSVPGEDNVQTDVTSAGSSPLRLDQVEALFHVVDAARLGAMEPAWGRARLAEIRASRSPVPVPLVLVGNGLAAIGLALILRGGTLEVALAGVLGAGVGVLRILQPRRSNLRPFLPLVASFLVATAVFLVARVAPTLSILPPLIAPLIPLLPGALLTMGTLELATGQALSGMARLGSGGLQLVLLAGGILGAAQFVGIPGPTDVVTTAATSATGWSGTVGTLAPWLGVALFGLGTAWARAAQRSSVPWILLALYVAYAGQILGGLYFGSAFSAFFGALAMTPVAINAARHPAGPPPLVTFLPAFWLLVPGALGLQGVTGILGEQGAEGITALVTSGAAMIGIALGILLGILVAAPDRWHLPRWAVATADTSPAHSSRADSSPADSSPTDTSPTDSSPTDTQ